MNSASNTGRLRIFSGLGTVRYDTHGAPSEERDERRERLFKQGVLLYYDPDERFVRCLFRAHKEQFLAEYWSRSADVVGEFRAALREALSDLGWELSSPGPTDTSVYHELGEVDPEEPPPYNERTLFRLLERGERLDFATPDKRGALALFEYFRAAPDDLVLAISQNGRIDVIDEVDATPDVVLKPDGTVDEVVGIGGTAATIEDAEHDLRVQDLADALERATAETGADPRGAEMAAVLTEAGIGEYGFVATHRAARSARRTWRRVQSALAGAPLAFVLVVVAGVRVTPSLDAGSLASALLGSVRLTVPPFGVGPRIGAVTVPTLAAIAVVGLLNGVPLAAVLGRSSPDPRGRVEDALYELRTYPDADVPPDRSSEVRATLEEIEAEPLVDTSEVVAGLQNRFGESTLIVQRKRASVAGAVAAVGSGSVAGGIPGAAVGAAAVVALARLAPSTWADLLVGVGALGAFFLAGIVLHAFVRAGRRAVGRAIGRLRGGSSSPDGAADEGSEITDRETIIVTDDQDAEGASDGTTDAADGQPPPWAPPTDEEPGTDGSAGDGSTDAGGSRLFDSFPRFVRLVVLAVLVLLFVGAVLALVFGWPLG